MSEDQEAPNAAGGRTPQVARDMTGSAAGALVGLALGGPAGAVVGAAVTPAAIAAIAVVENAARKRWARAEQAMETAAVIAGVSVSELEARLAEDDERLEMAAQVLSAAAQTTVKVKAEALAMTIAAISAASPSKLEQISLVVRALEVLEGLDLAVLDMVGRSGSGGVTPSALETETGIAAETLRPAVRLLELHGLITDRGRLSEQPGVTWELTTLGDLMLNLLRSQGSAPDESN